MYLKLTRLSFLLIFLFCLTSLSLAQGVTSAAINGEVKDNSGKAVDGANVVAVHMPTGTQFGISTKDNGRYLLQNLKVGGPYTIKVTIIGFAPSVAENVFLKLGQNLKLDFTLSEKAVELGAINVTGERNTIISSARTGASNTVAKEQIEAFPTISRSFQDFTKLTPQFSGTNTSAAGRNNRFNNIQIDGTQYNDLFGLGSSGTPGGQASTTPISLDAIQEFQVLIAPFDVRHSGFTGGGINAITRSGTNDYSGSAYYFMRNQKFIGTSPDELKTAFKDFNEYQAGFRVGGPIVKNKLFFFVNGEMTKRTEPQQNISLTQQTTFKVDSVANRMNSILMNKYGYNPGDYGDFTMSRPSYKLFARLDWNINENNRLTLRNNFVKANDDNLPRNITTFSFSDRNYKFNSQTNSTVLQLTSTVGNSISNELILGYTRIRDSRDASASAFPSVRVTGGPVFFWAGAEEFSQANRLDQDIFEITDNFTLFLGKHVVTFGTHNEFYKAENLFIRDLYGTWQFSNLDNFEKGIASRYSISYSLTGNPMQSAKWSSYNFGVYAQDEWSVLPNLKLTIGVRAEVPVFPTKPAQNDSVIKYFGLYTNKLPQGKVNVSPRIGFNYDVNGDKKLQLRGGAGLFTGRTPYVWISNQYGNTGVEFARIDVSSSVPAFVSDPYKQPIDPTKVNKTTEVNITEPEFRMPQLWRFNAAADVQLPFNLIGTMEFVYSKSVNDILYQDINIDQVNGVTYLADGRPKYSKSVNANIFTNVILMKNTNLGSQYQFTVQVQKEMAYMNIFKNMPIGISGTAAYTYGRAKDLNSVVSSQAISQWRFNPIPGDPNNPPLTTSNFEIKHRALGALTFSVEFLQNLKSTLTVYYNRQSGRPFSYTFNGDVNGDKQTTNDLVYIPKDQSDNKYLLVNATSKAAATQADYDALFNFINSDDYMKDHKGEIMERNAAVEPWINQIDLRFTQDIPNPFVKNNFLQVSLDILNFGNLINHAWGYVKSVPNQNYSIFKTEGTDAATGKIKYSFTPITEPFQKDNLLSRWQMQLGVRYSF